MIKLWDDPNDDAGHYGDGSKPIISCKFCGKGNLEWEDDNGKWVLIDC